MSIKTIRSALAACLLLTNVAYAQPYMELGLGAPTGGCIYRYTENRVVVCGEAVLGTVALGWRLPYNFSVQWEHWSSLNTSKDRGIDMVSIRWRINWEDAVSFVKRIEKGSSNEQ